MKISELVKLLEKHITENGDKPVYILNTENSSYDALDIEFRETCVLLMTSDYL